MKSKEIRDLLRRSRAASLATRLVNADGWPYGSMVTVAFDLDASPILLLSDLSDHSRNLADDPRASLLVDDARHLPNPQEGPRVSLLGKILREEEARLRDRFLARHPAAALYVDFADFRFYRMRVEKAHVVGGFARAAWLEANAFILGSDACTGFSSQLDTEIVERINLACGAVLAKPSSGETEDATAWRAAAIDPDGLDLLRNQETRRLAFVRPISSPEAAFEAAKNSFDAASRQILD